MVCSSCLTKDGWRVSTAAEINEEASDRVGMHMAGVWRRRAAGIAEHTGKSMKQKGGDLFEDRLMLDFLFSWALVLFCSSRIGIATIA